MRGIIKMHEKHGIIAARDHYQQNIHIIELIVKIFIMRVIR